MIDRLLTDKIKKSPKSVLILGPRQVGKSTLLLSLNPDLIINLADQSEYLSFTSSPDELITRISELNPKTVFVDEIQRIPDLLNTIQAIIDKKKNIKFYISGSSARKLRRSSANLLPGRLFNYRLNPLSFLEIKSAFDTKKALSTGTLPEPYLMKATDHTYKLLQSYTGTYLQEEILNESLVRQISGFSRFLKLAAENAGQFLDFSKLASKAKVHRSAARRYYEILEDTLICERVEAYSAEAKLDLVKHPKYYFFDVGIVNALLGNFTISADRVGRIFEHFFFNQLKNTSYALDIPIEVFHYRTRSGSEVDFLVKIKNQLFAIEIKASEPQSNDLKALKALQTHIDEKISAKFVACIKCSAKKIDGISILPWDDVIRRIFDL